MFSENSQRRGIDTVSGCLREAGEIIQAKLLPDQVVELGELFMLKKEAEELASRRSSVDHKIKLQPDSAPLHRKPYGMNREQIKVVKRWNDDMLGKDFI